MDLIKINFSKCLSRQSNHRDCRLTFILLRYFILLRDFIQLRTKFEIFMWLCLVPGGGLELWTSCIWFRGSQSKLFSSHWTSKLKNQVFVTQKLLYMTPLPLTLISRSILFPPFWNLQFAIYKRTYWFVIKKVATK